MTAEDRRRILEFLEDRAGRQLDFVVALCRQNSHSRNKAGVDRVGGLVAGALDGVFSSHETVAQPELGDCHVFRDPGAGRPVCLAGHLDTVFPPGHAFQDCRIEGDRLVGPGTGDMKGGIAVMVFALLALREAGLIPGLGLTLILNGDEEIGSPASRAVFERERVSAAACLVAECAGPAGEIVVSRNGKMGARLDCYGQDRHVGFGTHEKASAILELAQRIIGLEALNGRPPGVSVNAGTIDGGLGPSTVPARASGLFDIRWETEEQERRLLESIDLELARPSRPGCRSEWTVLNRRPAMPLGEGTKSLFARLRATAAGLGQDIAPEHRRGTSDANFFGAAGVPTLDGFGPVCAEDHTPRESIRISSLRERSALLALFLAELGRGARPES